MEIHSVKESRHHFAALDGWRGLCACMVALFHFRAFSHITNSTFIQSGGNFLDLFFVLSGFVIFYNYYKRLAKGYSLRDFMLLRLGRLYPLHFFVLMLFLFGDFLQIFIPVLSKGATYPPFHGPGEGPRYIIANLLLIHSFNVTDYLSFNIASWSISAEFYTYLLYAAAIVFSKGRPAAILVLTACVSVYLLIDPTFMKGTSNMGFIRCVYGFGWGGLTWFLFQMTKDRILLMKKAFFDLAEICLFAGNFVYLHYLLQYFDTLPRLVLVSPLLFSLTVFVFAFQKGIVSKLFTGRIFSLLGMLSYSIYMMHIFISGKIFYGLGMVVQKISGFTFYSEVKGISMLGTNLWMGDCFCLIYIFSVVACSYITYQLIEVPCRDWVRDRVKKHKTPAASII